MYIVVYNRGIYIYIYILYIFVDIFEAGNEVISVYNTPITAGGGTLIVNRTDIKKFQLYMK